MEKFVVVVFMLFKLHIWFKDKKNVHAFKRNIENNETLIEYDRKTIFRSAQNSYIV